MYSTFAQQLSSIMWQISADSSLQTITNHNQFSSRINRRGVSAYEYVDYFSRLRDTRLHRRSGYLYGKGLYYKNATYQLTNVTETHEKE